MLACRSIRDLVLRSLRRKYTDTTLNAGHNPAVVIRRGGAVAWLEASAPPVGLFADTVYRAESVQLYPGDLIVAYTDGMVEATNAASEEWRIEGLLACSPAGASGNFLRLSD